jgi:hypothetical protein
VIKRVTVLSPGADQLRRLGREWKKVLLELRPEKAMLGGRRKPPPITNFDTWDLEPQRRRAGDVAHLRR